METKQDWVVSVYGKGNEIKVLDLEEELPEIRKLIKDGWVMVVTLNAKNFIKNYFESFTE